MIDAHIQWDGLVPLDLENPETWFNRRAPEVDPSLQKALTEIGGLIPAGFGEFSGKAQFLLVWGQEYQTFLNGRRRLMFVEENIPARHQIKHFAVTPQVYERALGWFEGEEAKRQKAFLECNWVAAQKFPDTADYLLKEESSLDYFQFSPEAEAETIASLLPDGWRYLAGLYEYKEVGQQYFYVLQWFSPAEFGDENAWNELRYDWEYHPETDKKEFLDCIGEYPHHGAYEHPSVRVAEKVSEGYYRYLSPTFENTVEPLKELLRIRDETPEAQKTSEFQSGRRIYQHEKRVEKELRNFKTEFRARFRDSKPVGGGNPVSLPAASEKNARRAIGE